MIRHRQRYAFTLVELLVVIGIIAILISLLLPVLGKVQRASKQVACQSNMRQIAQWGLMYAQAMGGILPSGNLSINGVSPQWEEYSSSDVSGPKTWVTLAARPPFNLVKLTAAGQFPKSGTILYCPQAVASIQPNRGAYGTSYAINEFLGGQKYWPPSNPDAPIPRLRLLKPSVYWFAEAEVSLFTTNNYDFRTATRLSSGQKNWWPWSWDLRDQNERFVGHPNYVSNFVFGDGHVEAMTRKQFEAMGTAEKTRFMGKHY